MSSEINCYRCQMVTDEYLFLDCDHSYCLICISYSYLKYINESKYDQNIFYLQCDHCKEFSQIDDNQLKSIENKQTEETDQTIIQNNKSTRNLLKLQETSRDEFQNQQILQGFQDIQSQRQLNFKDLEVSLECNESPKFQNNLRSDQKFFVSENNNQPNIDINQDQIDPNFNQLESSKKQFKENLLSNQKMYQDLQKKQNNKDVRQSNQKQPESIKNDNYEYQQWIETSKGGFQNLKMNQNYIDTQRVSFQKKSENFEQLCKIHQYKQIEYYCFDCDNPFICIQCKNTIHKNHKIQSIDNVLKFIQNKQSPFWQQTQQCFKNIKNQNILIEQQLKTLYKNQQQELQIIIDFFDEIEAFILNKRKQLEIELNAKINNQSQYLQDKLQQNEQKMQVLGIIIKQDQDDFKQLKYFQQNYENIQNIVKSSETIEKKIISIDFQPFDFYIKKFDSLQIDEKKVQGKVTFKKINEKNKPSNYFFENQNVKNKSAHDFQQSQQILRKSISNKQFDQKQTYTKIISNRHKKSVSNDRNNYKKSLSYRDFNGGGVAPQNQYKKSLSSRDFNQILSNYNSNQLYKQSSSNIQAFKPQNASSQKYSLKAYESRVQQLYLNSFKFGNQEFLNPNLDFNTPQYRRNGLDFRFGKLYS